MSYKRPEFDTLYKATCHIDTLRKKISELESENAALQSAKTETKAQAQAPAIPEHRKSRSPFDRVDADATARYHARVSEAQKQVDAVKEAVHAAPSSAEQMLAMRELRLAEQKLQLAKRNFS